MDYKKKTIKPEPLKEFKGVRILMVGEGGVGKTALATRFATSTYDSKYNPTIGSDFFSGSVPVHGEEVKVIFATLGASR